MAAEAEPFQGHIDCDCPDFLAPGDMPSRINKYLADTGQSPTQDKGQMLRMILESLALKYRYTLESIEDVTGQSIDVLHIVGGGIKNELLCQLAANAIGRRVITGPIEATAIGNVLMQAKATGVLRGIDEARAVIARSFELKEYMPQDSETWAQRYKQYSNASRR
jgi:sugar (pentulose or hexulose) kinase